MDIEPKSPCELSLADKAKDDVPTDESVADIFDAIKPLLPTPHRITFDWHLLNKSTASLNGLPSEFFHFF